MDSDREGGSVQAVLAQVGSLIFDDVIRRNRVQSSCEAVYSVLIRGQSFRAGDVPFAVLMRDRQRCTVLLGQIDLFDPVGRDVR